jgi:cytochrome c-type biogenesis protein CcmH/NrfG
MAIAASAMRPNPGGWLFGRTTDLLLGAGLGYLLFIPILVGISVATGATRWPMLLAAAIGMLLNAPHYGATVIRVYGSREDRGKYVFFSVYATVALALVFIAASRSVWVATLLITAYLTWSPWHFSGQNYGLTLMFLRRRGIDVDPATKRLVYASFLLSAALAIMAIHAGNEHLVFAPSTLNVPNTPRILKLSLSAVFSGAIVAAVALAYLGCLAAAAWRLHRVARLRDLGPAFVLVLTQASWFAIPSVALSWSEARHDTLFFSAIWVSAAHSVQYLWVTAYYAKSSGPGTSTRRFLLKSFVAGAGVTTIPGLVLAPNLLGLVPWDAGLAATLFSIVNLHHFILDGAIWKLRDGRVARVLLRVSNQPTLVGEVATSRRKGWLPTLIWAAAGLSIAIPLIGDYALYTISRTTDVRRIDNAIRMLRWAGRETVEIHFNVGERLAASGNRAAAIEHFRRSIELFPTARVWAALGAQHRALGRWDLALAAFDSAVELYPDFWGAHYRRAEALLEGSSMSGVDATAQAIESLERVLVLSPSSAEAALMLARVHAESGRSDESIAVLEQALRNVDDADAGPVRRQLSKLRDSGDSLAP